MKISKSHISDLQELVMPTEPQVGEDTPKFQFYSEFHIMRV